MLIIIIIKFILLVIIMITINTNSSRSRSTYWTIAFGIEHCTVLCLKERGHDTPIKYLGLFVCMSVSIYACICYTSLACSFAYH